MSTRGFVKEESIKRGKPFIKGEWKEHIPKLEPMIYTGIVGRTGMTQLSYISQFASLLCKKLAQYSSASLFLNTFCKFKIIAFMFKISKRTF